MRLTSQICAHITPVRVFSHSGASHSCHSKAIVSVFAQELERDAVEGWLCAFWSIYHHREVRVHAVGTQVVLGVGLVTWFTVCFTDGRKQLSNHAVLCQQAWYGEWRSPENCHITGCHLGDGEELRCSRSYQKREMRKNMKVFSCSWMCTTLEIYIIYLQNQ